MFLCRENRTPEQRLESDSAEGIELFWKSRLVTGNPHELLGSFWGFGLSGNWLSTVSFQGHFLSSHMTSDLIFESTNASTI